MVLGSACERSALYAGPFVGWAGGYNHVGGFIRCTTGGTTYKATKLKMKELSRYSTKVLGSGPSNYWRLNETSGLSARDSVGTANGTISGGVTLNGESGMTFNGTTGKITTTSTIIKTPFAVEMRIRRASNIANQVLFSNNATGDYVAIFSGSDITNIWTGFNGATISFPYDNNWHYLVWVFPHNGIPQCYIDGNVFTHDVTPISFTAGIAKTIQIGHDPNWTYFNGSLKDIAIYPRALTPAEILDHYNSR